jgi:hypothetical protein
VFKEVSLSCKQTISQNKLTQRCRVFAENLTVALDIACFLCNSTVHYRGHKSPQSPAVNDNDDTFLKLVRVILFVSLLSA